MHHRYLYLISLSALVAACSATGNPTEGVAEDVAESESAQVGDTFNSGNVGMVVLPTGPNSNIAFANAGFEKKAEDNCMSVRSGACILSTCALTEPDFGKTVDAGKITITGGLQPITLVPDPVTHEYPGLTATNAVVPGQVLTVRAAGSKDVPSFFSRLTVPAPVTVVFPPLVGSPGPGQPPLTDDQKLHIPRNRDFEIKWSGGTGHVLARLVHFTLTTTDRYITCEFQATERKGVIPSKFLKFFPQRPEEAFLFELTSEAHLGKDGYLEPRYQSPKGWHIGKQTRMLLQGTQEILFD